MDYLAYLDMHTQGLDFTLGSRYPVTKNLSLGGGFSLVGLLNGKGIQPPELGGFAQVRYLLPKYKLFFASEYSYQPSFGNSKGLDNRFISPHQLSLGGGLRIPVGKNYISFGAMRDVLASGSRINNIWEGRLGFGF